MAATCIIGTREELFNTQKHLHFSLCNCHSRINTVPEWFISSMAFVLSCARWKGKRHHKQIQPIICVPCGTRGSPLLGCELFWAGLAMLVSAPRSCPPLCGAWGWGDTSCVTTLTPLSLRRNRGVHVCLGVSIQTWEPGTLLSVLVRCSCMHWRWQPQEGQEDTQSVPEFS